MKLRLFLLSILGASLVLGEQLPQALDNYGVNNGALGLSSVISPASLSADQNDYAPIDATSGKLFANAGTVRLTSSVVVSITGLTATGALDGQVKILHNIGTSVIKLINQSASSSSANRFKLMGDVWIGPDAVAVIQRDGTTSGVWRVVPNRSVPRVLSLTAPSSSPAINSDNYDNVNLTGINGNLNLATNLTGTPANFQRLVFRFKDDGTQRTLTWGTTLYKAFGATPPANTTVNKVLTVGFMFDSADSKWGCVASVVEP